MRNVGQLPHWQVYLQRCHIAISMHFTTSIMESCHLASALSTLIFIVSYLSWGPDVPFLNPLGCFDLVRFIPKCWLHDLPRGTRRLRVFPQRIWVLWRSSRPAFRSVCRSWEVLFWKFRLKWLRLWQENLGCCLVRIIIPLLSGYAIFHVQPMWDVICLGGFTCGTPQTFLPFQREILLNRKYFALTRLPVQLKCK